jgi:hypothetical protein
MHKCDFAGANRHDKRLLVGDTEAMIASANALT